MVSPSPPLQAIQAPPFGSNWREKNGYVEGIYFMEGRRVYRGLGRLDAVLKHPSGKRRTAKQLDKAIQPLWEARRLELLKTLPPAVGTTRAISEVFADWILDANSKSRATDTIRARELCRDYYLQIVGDHQVEEPIPDTGRVGFDLAHSDGFRTGLKTLEVPRGNATSHLTPARINTYLGLLRSALRFAEQRYWLTRAPDIEKVVEHHPPPKTPSPAHRHAMRKRLVMLCRDTVHGRDSHAYRHHLLLFYLLSLTGMRGGEPLSIRKDQVFLEEQSIFLIKTKTGQPRLIRMGRFLVGKLKAHFRRYPDTTLLFEHSKNPGQALWRSVAEASRAMDRHMAALKIRGSFQPLRGYRTGFSTAGLNDIRLPASAIQGQLGHQDLQTTMRYYVSGMDAAQLAVVSMVERQLMKNPE